MLRRFRNLAIALKLNLVQGVVLLIVILAATLWTAAHLRQSLTESALNDLRQTNRLVVAMLQAYDQSLRNDIERAGRIFAGTFDKQLELVAGGAVPRLLQRGTPIDDRIDVVDAFTEKARAVATIFVRQGDDFLRTATSLKKDDGTRATGTLLGADHPARQALLAGGSYTGKALLFGKDFMTHYVATRDATGKVVGALFVGLEFTEGLKALKQSILALKIAETGYVYALDAGRQRGVLTIHPSKEGSNLLAAKDSPGFEFAREMLDKKSGTIRYDWANPGDPRARENIVVYEHYPAWDWVVASGSHVEEFGRSADAAVFSIVLMSLAIVIATVVSGLVVTSIWVTRPLEEVIVEADRIATGDLTSQLTDAAADEIGRLKKAIVKMADHLKTAIGDVRSASATMLDHSSVLVASAKQVNQGSAVQRQVASSVAASIEQLSAAIAEVATHGGDAQRISNTSGQAASEGAEVVRQAVDAMNQITGFVRQASTTVGELGRRSQDISAVVQVIGGIADQTNLLALNAAIEAARAGEQGRGFAVVADEVRKLAERTAKSTRSIGEMITGIQEGAQDAIRQMEDGVARVEQGSLLADHAGKAIGEIEASTREVSAAVDGISSAIKEQTAVSQMIARGVEQMAGMAKTSHSASNGTAQSAQALHDMAVQLDQTIGRFRVR